MLGELMGYRVQNEGWRWGFTLDFEVDRVWRAGLRTAGSEVIRFKPVLSVGQASWLADRLNRKLSGSWTPETLKREMANACKQAGISPDRLSQLRWIRWTEPNTEQASTSSRAPLDNRVLDQMIRILAGRSLLSGELVGLMEACGLGAWKEDWHRYVQAGVCLGAVDVVPGMDMQEKRSFFGLFGGAVELFCRRCGSTGADLEWVDCRDCGSRCPYCVKCLTMGRIRRCTVLVRGVGTRVYSGAGGERGKVEEARLELGVMTQTRTQTDDIRAWVLSPAQEAASREGLRFLQHTARDVSQQEIWRPAAAPPRFLIWAVTGAGKTEMIFPLLAYELRRGRRVLVTTPRKDVVLELKPRLAQAFPGHSVVALYGGSEDRWESGEITLATTHQLMRFYQAFDLVIIDELDAYPYHNNPMLIHAAEQVCKPGGRYVLLSATPPPSLQKEAFSGKLPHVSVPVRYHRRPLPVPVRVVIPPLDAMIRRKSLPPSLRQAMDTSVKRGAQLFVFVPKIILVEPMVRLLSGVYPSCRVQGTSSKDENRGEKVTDFREKRVELLVTTTILERGVTVPKTDVFILGADSPLFDEASLVQMAGRAGRSKDDPFGRVVFAAKEWTASQASAIRQIRHMNRIAAEKGYLLGDGRAKEC